MSSNNIQRNPILESAINDITNKIQIFKMFVDITEIRVFVYNNNVPRIEGKKREGRKIFLETTDGLNYVEALREVLKKSRNNLNHFNDVITSSHYKLEDFLSLLRV